MRLDEDAYQVVGRLQNAGYEAYFVGGCVRDMLLKKKPKDFDIVTSATPDQVITLFPQHYIAGKQFGVIGIQESGKTFEVATFRTESGYSDRRRPDDVQWSDAKGDVERRDFTVNGLLFDPVANRIIDYINGQRDLSIKVIRFIGNPGQRVQEDPLRILRAVRLKNALGFQYDKATFDALSLHGGALKHVALERVGDELTKMLAHSSRLMAIEDLERLHILGDVLPEIDRLKGTPQPLEYHHEGDVYDHTLRAIAALPGDAPAFLAWAVLFHDAGKPETLTYPGLDGKIGSSKHSERSAELAVAALQRLRRPRTEQSIVDWLIQHHMKLKDIEAMRLSRQEAYVLDPRFLWLLELHRADAEGTEPKDLSLYLHNLKLYKRLKAHHKVTHERRPPLLVDGHDLQENLGLQPGRQIGELLEEIRDAQLHGTIKTREEALVFARQRLNA